MRLLQLESALLEVRAFRRRIEHETRPHSGVRVEASARVWWIAGVAIVTALALLTLGQA